MVTEQLMAVNIYKSLLNGFDDLDLVRETKMEVYQMVTSVIISEGQKALNGHVKYMIETQERLKDPKVIETLTEEQKNSDELKNIATFDVEKYRETMQKDLDLYASTLNIIMDEKIKALN